LLIRVKVSIYQISFKGVVSISNSRKIKIVGILFVIIFLPSIVSNLILAQEYQANETLKIHTQSENHYIEQILEDPSFDSHIGCWNCSAEGDYSDVSGSLSDSRADFHILGSQHTFTLIADPPLALNWTEVDNPNFPDHPDVDEITEEGCRVSHEFDDQTAVQNPSVHWDRNVTVPVNMLDYIITSASIQAVVNATVDENLDRYFDYLNGSWARRNPNEIVDTYGVGDYVRFYVLISDLEKNKVYEIANFQTDEIGSGSPPGTDYLLDTYMLSVPEDVLQFYLSSVLNTDNHNFTVSLGIRLHIEDNVVNGWDLDIFNELIIKSVNLTFTYEKKIDKFTSVSWSQIGIKIEDISRYKIEITDANINFKYKIDKDWPSSLSPNSEMRILVNNIKILETIKLIDTNASSLFQEAGIGGFDITSMISKEENVSIDIQLYIADEFIYDQIITVSIDDVFLEISYIEFIPEGDISTFLLWLFITALLSIIGILGSLSLRSYVFLPRQQRKKSYLLQRTQKFKDIRNLQAIIAMHKPSGLPVYSQSYSSIMRGKNTLFSGFIQAISIIGDEITGSDKRVSITKRNKDKLDFNKVVELDLKQFYCLILDVEELRTVVILKSKSSKRLKDLLVHFSFAVYVKISERLKNWNNDIHSLDEIIQPLVFEYFDIYYKDPFKVNIQESELIKYKKKLNLSKAEFHIMNTIFLLLKEKSHFRLMDILERETDKNEDEIINALESLIEFKLISPIK